MTAAVTSLKAVANPDFKSQLDSIDNQLTTLSFQRQQTETAAALVRSQYNDEVTRLTADIEAAKTKYEAYQNQQKKEIAKLDDHKNKLERQYYDLWCHQHPIIYQLQAVPGYNLWMAGCDPKIVGYYLNLKTAEQKRSDLALEGIGSSGDCIVRLNELNSQDLDIDSLKTVSLA